jgi:hypothetical protein
MTTRTLLLAALTLTGCTANTTLNVAAPVTIAAPVSVTAATQVSVASNTLAIAPAALATPAPTPLPTATPSPAPTPTATPTPVRKSGGGGSGGGGGGRSAPAPVPAPTPVPTPTPTPRPVAYAPSSPTGAGTADAAHLLTGDTSISSGNGTSYAQTFKATRDGRLAALAVYCLAGGPEFNIAIQGVDAQGRPVGPDLGTTVLDGSQMWRPTPPFNPDDVWPAVTPAIVRFDPPVPVTAGATYAWVATPTEGSQHAKWVGTMADGYADGKAFIRLSTTWKPITPGGLAPTDYNFETFLLAPEQPPEASGAIAATPEASGTAE